VSEQASPRPDQLSPTRALPVLRSPKPRPSVVRAPPDRTQRWRRLVQLAFLVLNLAIGFQFLCFVRFYESGGRTPYLPRPPGVEGWLPIAGLMNLKATILTGKLPARFPAGVVLLVTFLAITFLFRKTFCSWLCPVGTMSEGLWKLGRRLLGSTFAPPRWLDAVLRAPKYLLLAFFLWAATSLPVEGIEAFFEGPYGTVADVKMLDFFRHMGAGTAVVLVLLGVFSLLVQNPWCRYLCPYGALHGLVSWISPTRIRRDAATCIDCARCARVCPSRLPVDVKPSMTSPECTGCLECVAACPVRGALAVSVTSRRRVSTGVLAAMIALLLAGAVGLARLTGHWRTEVDPSAYAALIPHAAEVSHPR
jgi:polyferredoxin